MQKKYFITLGITLFMTAGYVMAQRADAKKLLTAADDNKTMTKQQSIANFLQAVANNLTSTSKNAQIKASLFALNWTDSAKKYQSDYYLRHTWQRHTQLQIGGGLDANSNFNAFSAGASYDVLHFNDVTEYDDLSKDIQPILERMGAINSDIAAEMLKAKETEFTDAVDRMVDRAIRTKDWEDFDKRLLTALVPDADPDSILKNDAGFQRMFAKLKAEGADEMSGKGARMRKEDPQSYTHQLASYLAGQYYERPLFINIKEYLYYILANGKEPGSTTGISKEDLDTYKKSMATRILANKEQLHSKNLVNVYNYIAQMYKTHIAKLKLRPSLVLSYNYTYNTTVVQNQHLVNLTFLVGFGNPNKPWEFNAGLGDSASTDTTHFTGNHNITIYTVGISKVLANDADGAALFQVNLVLEYDHTSSSSYGADKRDNYFPSLTIQARPSAKSPWVSIGARRDVNHSNFLGFLNVTFNISNAAAASSTGN